MQIEHLQYLQAIVEEKSMNKAAKTLFVTQPAISAGIKAIENELGYPVIERTSKGVTPTEFGKYVLEDSKLILSYVERWKDMADKLSKDQPVRIVFTGTAPRFNIVNAIVRAQRMHPSIKIDVSFQHVPTGGTSHVDARIGIQYKIPTHIKDAKDFAASHGLNLALLQQDEFQVFANADNPLFELDEIHLEDLRNRKILLFQNPTRFPYIDKLYSVNADVSTQMYHEDNLMVAISLMKDAVAIRPSKTAQRNPWVENGGIKVAPIIDCPMPVNLYVNFPNDQRIFKSERIFIDALSESFPMFELV